MKPSHANWNDFSLCKTDYKSVLFFFLERDNLEIYSLNQPIREQWRYIPAIKVTFLKIKIFLGIFM